MKNFLIRLGGFTIFWIGFIAFVYFMNRCVIYLSLKRAYQNHSTLILGDSCLRYLDESIISNSLNLAYGGENFKVCYQKLKYFSKFNDLENVILPFNVRHLGYRYNSDIKSSFENYKRLYAISPLKSMIKNEIDNHSRSIWENKIPRNASKVMLKNLFTINIKYLLKFLNLIQVENDIEIDENNLNIIDEKKVTTKLSKSLESIDSTISWKYYEHTRNYLRQYYYLEHKEEISNLNIKYLQMIADDCSKRGINLFILQTSEPSILRSRIPSKYREEYQFQIDKLKSKDNVVCIDLIDALDEHPECMLDNLHWTAFTSDQVSKLLNEYYLVGSTPSSIEISNCILPK